MRNKQNIVVRAAIALATVCVAFPTAAQEKLAPPPYVLTGFDTISTGVTWDEAAVKKVLPPGVVPAKEMTGGINIYTAKDGYGPGPYSAAYFWIDLEGIDAADGTKGRWLLTGVYGPSSRAKASFEEFYGLPIRTGSARHEPTSGGGVRAVGSFEGRDLIAVEAKVDESKCQPGGGGVNFMSDMPRTNHLIAFAASFWGEVCPAEVISARVVAPAGDPFAQFQSKKVNWSIRFRGSVAVAPPVARQ